MFNRIRFMENEQLSLHQLVCRWYRGRLFAGTPDQTGFESHCLLYLFIFYLSYFRSYGYV